MVQGEGPLQLRLGPTSLLLQRTAVLSPDTKKKRIYAYPRYLLVSFKVLLRVTIDS
jgi:hypothetical protein